jgi:pimeloyl-ACP methyl ester carboxylesterase
LAIYPAGDSHAVVVARGIGIEVFLYKPPAYRGEGLIVSLHGLGRNAPAYREHTRALAEHLRALLVVPLFDRGRFPTWRYQQAGIARRDEGGALILEPAEQWTGEILQSLLDTVRKQEGVPGMPYVLIGHSAGAQFALRATAFGRLAPARIVIANPSSWLAPTFDEPYPYGFGDLPPEVANDAVLRRYLAQPFTILLGTADTGSVDLSMTAGAQRQGAHRYARGTNVFHAAAEASRRRGWAFGWQLIEIHGVGHSARRMYANPSAAHAFCPEEMASAAAAERAATVRTWPCSGKPVAAGGQ